MTQFKLHSHFARNGEADLIILLTTADITALFNTFAILAILALAVRPLTRGLQQCWYFLLQPVPLRKSILIGSLFIGIFSTITLWMLAVGTFGLITTWLVSGFYANLFACFAWWTFVYPILMFNLPNMFASTSLLFSLVLLSRQDMAGYVGGVVLLLFSAFIFKGLPGNLGSCSRNQNQVALRQENAKLVKLEVDNGKQTVNPNSIEQITPINDAGEIGNYTETADPQEKKPKIPSEDQRISVTRRQKPIRGGIDPSHLIIDPNMAHNMGVLSICRTPTGRRPLTTQNGETP